MGGEGTVRFRLFKINYNRLLPVSLPFDDQRERH